MPVQIHIPDLHEDHKVWISELLLAKDELKSFSNRLGEVSIANTDSATLSQVEHFQNSFIRQSEVIDTLKHDIVKCEKEIQEQLASNNVATERKRVSDDAALRENMGSFQKLFAELKRDFMLFLAKAL